MVDANREKFGVEPIYRVLGIAPSTYYAVKASQRDPAARTLRDRELLNRIRKVHEANYGVYGARKVWWTLRREGVDVARCTTGRARPGPRAARLQSERAESSLSPGLHTCGWRSRSTRSRGGSSAGR